MNELSNINKVNLNVVLNKKSENIDDYLKVLFQRKILPYIEKKMDLHRFAAGYEVGAFCDVFCSNIRDTLDTHKKYIRSTSGPLFWPLRLRKSDRTACKNRNSSKNRDRCENEVDLMTIYESLSFHIEHLSYNWSIITY